MRRQIVIAGAPNSQLLGDAAVLRGPVTLDIYRTLMDGIRSQQHRDAIEPNAELLQAVAVLKRAAEAARQGATPDVPDTSDVRERGSQAPLMTGERIGIQEVAEMCGLSDRQARRIAGQLGGRKTRSGHWAFDRGLVRAYIATEGRTA